MQSKGCRDGCVSGVSAEPPGLAWAVTLVGRDGAVRVPGDGDGRNLSGFLSRSCGVALSVVGRVLVGNDLVSVASRYYPEGREELIYIYINTTQRSRKRSFRGLGSPPFT